MMSHQLGTLRQTLLLSALSTTASSTAHRSFYLSLTFNQWRVTCLVEFKDDLPAHPKLPKALVPEANRVRRICWLVCISLKMFAPIKP